jgi:hypothetical protein
VSPIEFFVAVAVMEVPRATAFFVEKVKETLPDASVVRRFEPTSVLPPFVTSGFLKNWISKVFLGCCLACP